MGDFKSNQCLDNRALFAPLPPPPSSSSESQGYLLTNNPRRQQDGAPGLPQPQKRPAGKRLRVCPRPGLCGRGGKGWEGLPPSSPCPFLNISVSIAALGSQPQSVPCLGEVSAPVLSPQGGAVTLNPGAEHVPPVRWPLQHPWTLLSSIPTSCHKCIGKGRLAECLPHAIIPIRISG